MPIDLLANGPEDLLAGSEPNRVPDVTVGARPQQSQQPQGLAQQLTQHPVTQSLLGAGDAVRNNLSNFFNLIAPGTSQLIPGGEFQQVKSGQGTAYEGGKLGGDIFSFLGAGGPARAGLGAIAKAPGLLSKGAQALGGSGVSGLTRRALGSSAYEATENPEERGMAALKGGGLSAALDIGLGAPGKIINALRPKRFMEKIIENVTGGKTLDVVRQDLAHAIKDSGKEVQKQSTKNYNKVLESHGEKEIYERNPIKELTTEEKTAQTARRLIGAGKKEEKESLEGKANLEKTNYNPRKKIQDEFSGKVKEAHRTFVEKPTLRNAHKLQHEIGSATATMERNINKTNADREVIAELNNLRKGLNRDSLSFLKKTDKQAAEDWQHATNFHREEVIPYSSSPALRNIKRAKEGKQLELKPGTVTALFRSPSPEVQKIAQHLGGEGSLNILATRLGRAEHPEQALKIIKDLKHTGYSKYVPEFLKSNEKSLGRKIVARNIARIAAPALGGIALGASFGPLAELSGAIAGGAAGHFTPKLVGSTPTIGRGKLGQTLAKAISGLVSGAKAGVITRGSQ
jgi:hypothetical protein